MIDTGHRRRGVQPCGLQGGDQTPLVQQPRVAVIVHVAGRVAGANGQAAGDPRRGANLQPVVGGDDGGGARGIQVRPDDHRSRSRRADGVDGGRRAAEALDHFEFGVEPEPGQQHGGVTAFQQWQVPADEDDALHRASRAQRGSSCFHGKRYRVLVVTGHPVMGVPQHGR